MAGGLEATAVILYLLGVRRLARRGRHWSPWRTAAFVAGAGALWMATGSGLAAYDDINVTLHVVQHILLMMVAPPLIVLAQPLALACQAASRNNQVRVVHLLRLPVVRVLSFPAVAGLAYFGSMYAYLLLTGVYGYSIQHPLVHEASHLVFFTIGCLYWQPLFAGEHTEWRLSYPARILASVAAMPFELFLGLSFLLRTRPLDPTSTVGDTHAAGQAFWILAMLTSGVWAAVLAWQWLRQIEGHTRREDHRAQLLAAQSRHVAADLGLPGVADGWTVPRWRLARLQADGPFPAPPPPPGRGP